ncbi:hypothetical protein ACGIF2_16585 [Cellulomonas sp. P22]|uniref:hypothetical protein n=1 Tax=Cellulomonas sp. P22 TaxID=3373189 RepID=UPI0037A2F158
MTTTISPEATLDELYTMLERTDAAVEPRTATPATGIAHVEDFESFYWFTLRVPGSFYPGETAPR